MGNPSSQSSVSMPSPDQNRKFWDSEAARWEAISYAQNDPGGIWHKFPKDQYFEKIVDLGCGNGRHAAYLFSSRGLRWQHYTALDISPGMLERFRERASQREGFPLDSLTTVAMPLGCDPVPVADNSTDLVMSNSVLMHLTKEDANRALSDIARILKPGGCLILHDSFHNSDAFIHRFYQTMRPMLPKSMKSAYFYQYDVQEIQELIAVSGVQDKIGNYQIVPCYRQLIPSMMFRVLPFLKSVDEAICNRWKSEKAEPILTGSYSVYSTALNLG